MFKTVRSLALLCSIITGLSAGLLMKNIIKNNVPPATGFNAVISAIGSYAIAILVENMVYKNTETSIENIETIVNNAALLNKESSL